MPGLQSFSLQLKLFLHFVKAKGKRGKGKILGKALFSVKYSFCTFYTEVFLVVFLFWCFKFVKYFLSSIPPVKFSKIHVRLQM